MKSSYPPVQNPFVSRRKLTLSVKRKIMNRARVISEYWHSIPTEDDMRVDFQMDQTQWERYKKENYGKNSKEKKDEKRSQL